MADEETTPEETETPAEEAPATEAAAEEAPEAAAEETPAAPAEEAAAPAEVLTPKQRRQRARANKAATRATRTSMTPEERQAERDADRRRKAGLRRTRRLREREQARQARASAPTPEPLPSLRPERTGQLKTRQGIVVSDKAAKTITVRIDVTRRHPRYEKVVRTSTTLHAHDEQNDAHTGDTVVIRESRPLSRTKRWRLVEVLERAK
jgi:small subunit ribosomal protein S17